MPARASSGELEVHAETVGHGGRVGADGDAAAGAHEPGDGPLQAHGTAAAESSGRSQAACSAGVNSARYARVAARPRSRPAMQARERRKPGDEGRVGRDQPAEPVLVGREARR